MPEQAGEPCSAEGAADDIKIDDRILSVVRELGQRKAKNSFFLGRQLLPLLPYFPVGSLILSIILCIQRGIGQ